LNRFPDFKLLSPAGRFDDLVSCVIITHFHLDHCGALPYFTEVLGYSGPIYATYPTKILMPVMLEDYHRVCVRVCVHVSVEDRIRDPERVGCLECFAFRFP